MGIVIQFTKEIFYFFILSLFSSQGLLAYADSITALYKSIRCGPYLHTQTSLGRKA